MEAQLPDQIIAISFRINVLERDITDLKEQFNRYVPIRENDLQLSIIRNTVNRIEQEITEARKQLSELSDKLVKQEKDVQQRDAAQRESQAALQIRVLWGTVSIVIAVLTSILIGYITHFFR